MKALPVVFITCLASTLYASTNSSWIHSEGDVFAYYPSIEQDIYQHRIAAQGLVLASDVVFNCLKSGVGAVLSDDNFFSGCWKGAVGGVIVFAGTLGASYNRYPFFGAAGKLVNDLGVSIADNAMRGDTFLAQYVTDIGPLTITIRGDQTHLTLSLTSIAAIMANIMNDNNLDLKQSLSNLTPIFIMNGQQGQDKQDKGLITSGYTIGNVITYSNDPVIKNQILSHEFNHVLFYSNFRFCNDIVALVPYISEGQRYFNLGQDGCYNGAMALESFLPAKAFNFYAPMELRAYTMQKW